MKFTTVLFTIAMASVAVIAAPAPAEGLAAEVGARIEARNPEPEPGKPIQLTL